MIEIFPLFSLFIVALSYGATACMLSCMPLLSPILLSNSATRQQSLRILLPVTAGRITGYTLLSVIAFIGSVMLQNIIKDKELMGYLLGSITLFLAFRLWISLRNSTSCCTSEAPRNTEKGFFPLFLTGILLSLSLCAPVATMMAMSASASSLTAALLYGLAFGVGATLLWFFFFSVILTHILKESLQHLNTYRRLLQQIAPIVLAGMGISIFNGWIQL